ncbi:MAG TPA: Wzz/FepE/Etk N-terminal domain-containing protein [Candidatus Acidoferrales bacterium]|nr:Wzz/FepE/Etk N-terminal domain-containing protein [Candidatus Acidoferrales bacterium]
MSEKRQESPAGGMSIGDVYFILFRHKWKILFFALAGILGAMLLLYVVKPPQYQSEAMFSIRYVVEGKSLNPPGDESNTRPLDEQRASIINTEIATLNSLDLAKQVVQAMTPERILPKSGTNQGATNNQADRAAFMVRNGLTVDPIADSSVIRITFQYPDPSLVQPILGEIIDAYLLKHVQLHQGLGVPGDFLTNETVRLRAQLAETEDELRKVKNASGVISVDETQKAYAEQISRIHEDIFSTEVELAEHQAMLGALGGTVAAGPSVTNAESAVVEVPFDQIDKYRGICSLITSLQAKEQNYLTVQGFTPENVLVKQVHEQIQQNETLKRSLEEKYPRLATLVVPVPTPTVTQSGEAPIDLTTESEQVAALKVKIQTLNAQYKQVWTQATNFDRVRTSISELEQKREVEITDLKYFMNNLEEARIDEALGADKAANISIIQYPTPPVKGWSKPFKKKVAIVAVGGVMGGLALAFFIELFWDRSVKRPSDIETKLRSPLFISIPDISKNGHRRLADKIPLLLKDANGGGGQAATGAALPQPAGSDLGDQRHPLRRFYEGLRDRLVVYFEVKNLPHKPKLVGVTSCGKGAGVSSIATGLAASLSETGEGNVLLVDMTIEGGAARYFHKGKPNCGLDSALKAETRENALVRENLYLATEPMRTEALPQVMPKRFAGLISKIRSSDYDYIIFDMPPVAETTMTFRAARFMDMVLLVIESEKTNQDVVKRVLALLAESQAKVSMVLNKTQTYVPRHLHQEFLHDP